MKRKLNSEYYTRVGVEKIYFDAAHYTKGISSKCMNLHGHTFRVDVVVYGEIDSETGMVIDFGILKKIVREIVEEYDHTIIVPRKDLDYITIKGPFNVSIKTIDYPEATTEYIAMDIAKKLYEKLKLPVKVRLYEGSKNFAEVLYDGGQEDEGNT